MKRVVRIVGAILAFATVVYAGDWSILHLRSKTYDSVTVQHYYAIAQKTGRIQLQYDRTYAQQCAQSLLPHGGLQPCWYVRRHTEQWTKI